MLIKKIIKKTISKVEVFESDMKLRNYLEIFNPLKLISLFSLDNVYIYQIYFAIITMFFKTLNAQTQYYATINRIKKFYFIYSLLLRSAFSEKKICNSKSKSLTTDSRNV
jgi:hypothetical protein